MAGKPTYKELDQKVKELERVSLERKCTEEALQKSEEMLDGIVASITDHMSMMDDEHNIVWANNVAKKLFGQDLVGRKCYSVYHGHDRPCEPCVVSKCFDDGKVHEHETMVVGHDGIQVVFWCVASVAAWNADGRPKLVVEISRDITRRKRVEEELKATRDDLEWWVKARTLELEASNIELQVRHEDVLKHKLELEEVNKELFETNKAVTVLARNIDKKREEVEKKTALTIGSKIMPIIDRLQNDKDFKGRQTELDVLAAYLHDICSGLTGGLEIIMSFSPAEIRVAAMIKNGLTTKEIAGKLYISVDTVKTHRRNIRKKLNIRNSDINLSAYLRSKWNKSIGAE